MVIQSLSLSMVLTYLRCGRRFYYEVVERRPRLPSPVLALGSSFHQTVRENAFQKVHSSKDLSASLLKNFFAEDLESSEVDWSGQSLAQTKDQGVVCVDEYRYKMAPKTQPAFVEYGFSMDVIGRPWKITGKVDLITNLYKAVDHKTTKGQLRDPKPDHVFQMWVYLLALRILMGLEVKGQLDYYPRGKDTSFSHEVAFQSGLERNVLTTFEQVAKGIKNEVWPANRGNYLCKRRYCDFWPTCEIDNGGRVPD